MQLKIKFMTFQSTSCVSVSFHGISLRLAGGTLSLFSVQRSMHRLYFSTLNFYIYLYLVHVSCGWFVFGISLLFLPQPHKGMKVVQLLPHFPLLCAYLLYLGILKSTPTPKWYIMHVGMSISWRTGSKIQDSVTRCNIIITSFALYSRRYVCARTTRTPCVFAHWSQIIPVRKHWSTIDCTPDVFVHMYYGLIHSVNLIKSTTSMQVLL